MFHCSVIKVLCHSHQTALIVYHIQNRLSRTFFIYFFAFRKLLFALSSDNFYNLSYQLSSVKNFFNFFRNQLIFKKWFLCDSQIIITPHILAVNCFLTYLQFIFMITVSKGILRVMLACKWRYTLLTRPHMSKKWGGAP